MNHLLALHTDHVLLTALLTALVAPGIHLIVRTPEPDISLVARLVVWTLSSVFDYPTHRVKLRPSPPNSPPPSTTHFLKSLFFTNPPASSASAHTSQDESSDPTKSRRSKSRHSRTIQHLPHARQPDAVATPPSSYLHVNPLGLSYVSNKPTTGQLHPESLGVHYHHRNYILKENSSPPQLSRALVISGIEDATLQSQRTLAQVMTDNRIILDPASDSSLGESWDLPDGFIVVCICPTDPRERPNIHHSLLDKFAMSCNVLIKPNLRQAIQLSIPPSNPKRPISVPGGGGNNSHHSNTSSPLVNSHIQLPPSSRLSLHRSSYHSASASASSFHRDQFPTLTIPVLPKNFISNLQKAYFETYISPTLVTYLNDLFSATRHRAELDGTFLTARCMSDAEKLARAHRVVCTDLNGMELLREGDDHDWLQEEQADGGDNREQDDNNDRATEDDDDENSDEQWQTVEADEFSAFGVSFNPKKQTAPSIVSPKRKRKNQKRIPMQEVTEINIARMFSRCVSHRLRVRDGPKEEVLASMVFGATFDLDDGGAGRVGDSLDGGNYEERPTVKDVLVSILSEV